MANRCGIGLFTTGKKDPMLKACELHDKLYIENKLHGGEKLRSQIDKQFYTEMKKTASTSRILQCQSILYYVLARGFGWIPWHFNRKNGV